jgi:hypothetical protein
MGKIPTKYKMNYVLLIFVLTNLKNSKQGKNLMLTFISITCRPFEYF